MKVLATLLFSFFVLAQDDIFIDTNQNFPSIKRYEIRTQNFRVIFPENLKKQAQLVASALEESASYLGESLNYSEHEPIDVILQNKSAQSNGYVALAPFRSEWESIPSSGQSLGNTNWFITLAIHEQRHMQQFLKYKTGFAKAMYFLFGDFGKGISIFLSTPSWYFEGDAVVEETLLTDSGRGRIANFLQHYRAMILSNKLPDYELNLYRSYDEFMPNQYAMGYLLNLNLRLNYPKGTLDKVVSETANDSWNPFAFERALRLNTKENVNLFYQTSLKKFAQVMPVGGKSYPILGKNDELYTNNTYPTPYKEGVLYYKKGFLENGAFYFYDLRTKEETRLVGTNSFIEHRLKLRTDRFVYNDINPHPRYELVNYNDIYLFDLKTKQKKQLTHRGFYFYPQLSESNQIAAFRYNKQLFQDIAILDLKGRVLRKHSLPDFFTGKSLTWDGDSILVAGTDLKGKSLIYRLKNKKLELIFEQKNYIADIESYKGRIYFSSDISGIENIYRLSAGKLERVTDAKVGVSTFNISSKGLYFSQYGINGYRSSKLTKLKKYKTLVYTYPVEKLVRKEKTKALDIKINKYKADEYEKRTFRWHSWNYISSLLSPQLGIASISSRDNLNEFNITTGLLTGYAEGGYSYFLNFDYQKYWPVLHLRGSTGTRNETFTDEEKQSLGVDDISWKENNLDIGFTLPYKVYSSGNIYSFALTSLGRYTKVEDKLFSDDELDGERLGSLHKLSFSFNRQTPSYRFLPKYGFSLEANYQESNTKTGSTTDAYLKSAIAKVVLPGGFKSGSLYFDIGHEERSIRRFRFDNTLRFARGYADQLFTNTSLYSVNYTFTSFLPDLGFIFDLGFLRRIRTNLFYDRSVANFTADIDSYGIENVFDFAPLRIANTEISLGFRSSYRKIFETWEHDVYIDFIGGRF